MMFSDWFCPRATVGVVLLVYVLGMDDLQVLGLQGVGTREGVNMMLFSDWFCPRATVGVVLLLHVLGMDDLQVLGLWGVGDCGCYQGGGEHDDVW